MKPIPPFSHSLILLSCLLLPASVIAADLLPPPAAVLQIDHARVDAAFAAGSMITANTSFKVLAGRRTAPGLVEIHEHDTDIFYVLDGSATFVTGGTAVDPKPTAPGETRAKEMTGGEAHHLVKGDVIVIPAGVPHQFTAVTGAFLYYVVKVTR